MALNEKFDPLRLSNGLQSRLGGMHSPMAAKVVSIDKSETFLPVLSGHQFQNFQRTEVVADEGGSGVFYLVLEFGLDFGF